MPGNQDFSFKVLIAETQVPEYKKDDAFYIESNLTTPVSYHVRQEEMVNGETEAQMMPVTPYKLEITTKPNIPHCYYRVLVDGVKVKSLGLKPGITKLIRGFRDNNVLREFLFSLPRFGKEDDRIDPAQSGKIGTIEVQCWNAELRTRRKEIRTCHLNFKQASKKDSSNVTSGNYTMATSRVGKVVAPRSLARTVDYWHLNTLRSSITVRYHMANTLQQMGFILLPINILPQYRINGVENSVTNTDNVINEAPESKVHDMHNTSQKSCNCPCSCSTNGNDNKNTCTVNSTKREIKSEINCDDPLIISSDDDDDCQVVEAPNSSYSDS